ncbi:1,4-dihydroxy-2-naphthoate polyprenyltransferase [Actinocorallia sp. API 0066]|uniref:1,4-dihydroxy-2-naphthoate polyprenyltransferase n=1 Tax=Actinocorallia sp. API 0066 TaxID=2896846 RepID=UPI001E4903EB|nr:1,4-dihydroxy-2-naphthoate polyprenyltransferase [Actinocorallia sp. API 0066]MCD0453602.1 1,4-dihydroxy-2-naphthoate polyprenyltransferase [Actinocorallia sp. API 0066]
MNLWIAGARPRTLPSAVVPVAVGTGLAVGEGHPVWWRAALALLVALALQVGVNYANDYSDGVKGTDDERVGPLRLTGSGAKPPKQVLAAAFIAFGVGAVAGLVLAAVTSWWLLLVGAAAIAAGWFYTGGSRPYGYRALGELSVFVFFGLVAVVGTVYVQLEYLPWTAWAAAVPVGLLSCAMLVVNNIRDLDTDSMTGKRTLAVVLGDTVSRVLFTLCLSMPFTIVLGIAIARPWALIALLCAPLTIAPSRRVLHGAQGKELIEVLGETGRVQLVFGALLAVGLAV